MKKLTRSQTNRVISGVCGGIGEFLGIDPTIIRILFVIVTMAGGSGFLLYIILAVVLPEAGAPAESWEKSVERNAEQFAKSIENMGTGMGQTAKSVIGIAMIAFGFFFLMGNLNITLFNPTMIFPVVLILIGLTIIFKAIRK